MQFYIYIYIYSYAYHAILSCHYNIYRTTLPTPSKHANGKRFFVTNVLLYMVYIPLQLYILYILYIVLFNYIYTMFNIEFRY